MAETLGPKCRWCRREGMKLFLKGERCLTECSVERRSYPPGEHGRGRIKQSEYLLPAAREAEARRYYGLLEKQFRNYYTKAARKPGITGETLLRMLETRLDNVIYMSGSPPRAGPPARPPRPLPRQRPAGEHRASQVKPDHVVTMAPGSSAEQVIRDATDLTASVAPWLQADHEGLTGKVLKWPEQAKSATPVQEQLIVELYSK